MTHESNISAILSELWVTDTSPLIALAKIGHLRLLTDTNRLALIPETVRGEVLVGVENDPARQALLTGWGVTIPTPPVPPQVRALRLDAGEESVIAAALVRPGMTNNTGGYPTVVLDDGQARRRAAQLGLTVIGSLGVVLRARHEGRIAAAAPLLHALRDVGLYFLDAPVRAALPALGETWP